MESFSRDNRFSWMSFRQKGSGTRRDGTCKPPNDDQDSDDNLDLTDSQAMRAIQPAILTENELTEHDDDFLSGFEEIVWVSSRPSSVDEEGGRPGQPDTDQVRRERSVAFSVPPSGPSEDLPAVSHEQPQGDRDEKERSGTCTVAPSAVLLMSGQLVETMQEQQSL
jgi:hypothetical protein